MSKELLSKLRIRPVEKVDVKEFFNIYLRSVYPNFPDLYPDISSSFYNKIYRHEISLKECNCYVAIDIDEEIVGFFIGLKWGHLRHIAEGYILPDCKGIGLGTLLWKCTMRNGKDKALGSETAVVSSKNIAGFGSAYKMGLFHIIPISWFSRRLSNKSTFKTSKGKYWKDITTHYQKYEKNIKELDKLNINFTREAEHRFWITLNCVRLYAFFDESDMVGYGYLWKNGRFGPLTFNSKVNVSNILNMTIDIGVNIGHKHLTYGVVGSNSQVSDYLFKRYFKVEDVDFLLSNTKELKIKNYFPMVGYSI